MNDACPTGDDASSHFGKHNNQTENEDQERWWWVLCGLETHLYRAANEGSNQHESLGKSNLHTRVEEESV